MTASTHRGRRAKAAAVRQKFRALVERSLWPHFGSKNGVAINWTNDLIMDMHGAGLRIAPAPERKSP